MPCSLGVSIDPLPSGWYKDLIHFLGSSLENTMPAAPAAARPYEMFKFWFERRSRQRFPLALEVRYRLSGQSGGWGSGRTCNISSTGVLFEAAEEGTFVGPIELMVSWPCLLDGVCTLKLLMKGRVVRSEGGGVAMESKYHEFRTAGGRAGRKAKT